MQKLPLPPRIGAILVAAQGSRIARRACAALAEGQLLVDARMASDSDLLHLEDRGRDRRLDRVADEMKRILEQSGMPLADEGSEAEFLQAVLSGFPDRVARRRAPGSDRYLLASGQGAMLSPRSSVREAEWLVAVEVRSGGAVREAWIEVASRIEPEWLTVDREEIVHALDPGGAKVRATKTRWYGSIALEEHPVRPDPRAAAPLLREAFVQRGPGLANEAVMRRARFAGVEIDLESVARDAITGATMPELHLLDWIPCEARQRIEREAPTHLEVPSGRRIPLEYGEGGTVTLRVKLQEMFGLASTPRIGRERTPVTIELLAPNGRPVQVTRDLESFWNTTYAEVRKELRGRYPKHPWPDDPWNAEATARTKRREKE